MGYLVVKKTPGVIRYEVHLVVLWFPIAQTVGTMLFVHCSRCWLIKLDAPRCTLVFDTNFKYIYTYTYTHMNKYTYKYTHTYTYRRKFRSETSDNMDR